MKIYNKKYNYYKYKKTKQMINRFNNNKKEFKYLEEIKFH